MRIQEISRSTEGDYQYSGYRNAVLPLESVDSQKIRPVSPVSIAPVNAAVNKEIPHSIDGDILDFDWNRIRRFVERFSWDMKTPDITKVIDDFRAKKPPVYSFDGDRAEFDFDRAGKDINKNYGTYSPVNNEKTAPSEPKGECGTCAGRRYVDKSDDASVSYQTPTKLSPSTAALSVGSHEREHVANERAKAEREEREIVNQTVSIKYAICPECNIMYPSGGVTRTQSIKRSEPDHAEANEDTSQQSTARA